MTGRLVPFDAAAFKPGTYGFVGDCAACSGQRPAAFMLRLRYRRRGRPVTAYRPLCRECAERPAFADLADEGCRNAAADAYARNLARLNPTQRGHEAENADGIRAEFDRFLADHPETQETPMTDTTPAPTATDADDKDRRIAAKVVSNARGAAANLAGLRAALASGIAEYDAAAIADWAQRIAEAEVRSERWDTVCRVAVGERSTTEALDLVIKHTIDQIVIVGPDDAWSGRGNDLRRVKFDATRRWIDTARNVLQFG